jgi:hypothetical protein
VNEIRSRKTLIFRIKNCDDDYGILDEIGLVYLVYFSLLFFFNEKIGQQ